MSLRARRSNLNIPGMLLLSKNFLQAAQQIQNIPACAGVKLTNNANGSHENPLDARRPLMYIIAKEAANEDL